MKTFDSFDYLSELKRDVKRLLPNVILASSSLARFDLLKSLGSNVSKVEVPHKEENVPSTSPSLLVMSNAIEKKNAFFKTYKSSTICYPVITADTIVIADYPYIIKEGVSYAQTPYKILGKPKDETVAFNMIKLLSAIPYHRVFTGLTLSFVKDGEVKTLRSSSSAIVIFNKMSDDEIKAYVKTDDWKGAAGGYRIQGKAEKFIDSIYGDVSTVVGLGFAPLYEIVSNYEELR